MGRFWVVEVACGWFVANGWSDEGARPLLWGRRRLWVCGYGGRCLWVCGYGGYGLDETHGKWGAVSGLYRLDAGGGWSEEGDRFRGRRCPLRMVGMVRTLLLVCRG
ncbi:hypothetical protein CMV_021108 [Castanea mollissima]|uniref:Uncharacterized protein n=1 Tax=Castanea mollissima TaxID=60419 RepID=A0A8J4QKC4_9ROSI|nr:hypothetical protein CMV_021108 [Castanea mollissima]